jgi:hypothetical protein
VAVFGVKNEPKKEFKKPSDTINYIALSPPSAPILRAVGIDIQSVAIEWVIKDYAKPDYISGYKLTVNSEPNASFGAEQHGFVFNELTPGKSYKIELTAQTNSIVGHSEISKSMTIICPSVPKPPIIYESSTLKSKSVVISWKPSQPQTYNREDQILTYKLVSQVSGFFVVHAKQNSCFRH